MGLSDSSTLIHLASIGRLALLEKFYERITITPAVWREVVEQGIGSAQDCGDVWLVEDGRYRDSDSSKTGR